jgi:hypothetical protein
MKEPENIDDMFKSAFDEFSVTPDASVKSVIDVNLFTINKRFKIGFWLFFICSTVGLISFIFGIFLSPIPSQKYNQNETTISDKLIQGDVDSNFHMNKNHSEISTTSKRSIQNDDNPFKTETPNFIIKNKTELKLINPNYKEMALIKSNINQPIIENKLINDYKQLKKNQLLDVDVLEIGTSTSFIQERSDYLDLVSLSRDSKFNYLDEKEIENRPKQSLTAFISFGFESTTSERTQLKYEKLENGKVQFNTSEIILEYRRSILNDFELNLGMGYAHNKIIQFGEITVWDSINDNVSISNPNNPVYTPNYFSDDVNYRFQQIHLGIGLSYSHSLFQNWKLDLSAGSEFRIGQVKMMNEGSIFEAPEIKSLGVSIYFRPAVEYKIGKYSLLAFGQINQNIISQLSWSFIETRNPRFGGGIALRYNF